MKTYPTPFDYVTLDSNIDPGSRLCSLAVNVHYLFSPEEPLFGSALLGVTVRATIRQANGQNLLPVIQAKRVISLDQVRRLSPLTPLPEIVFDNAANNQTTPAFYDDNSYMRRVFWSNGKLYSGINSFDWTPELVLRANGNAVFNPANHNQPSRYRSRANGTYRVNVRDTVSNGVNGSPSNEQVDINH